MPIPQQSSTARLVRVRANRRRAGFLAFILCLCVAGMAAADPSSSSPEQVPVTRDAMKQALDASKEATPRLPLPPLTEEEKELIEHQKAEAAKTGEKPRRLGLANNGRMRAYYLGDYGFGLSESINRTRAGTDRNSNPGLDRDLRTSIFWIVSRGNNCTYCLGHQESSLSSRGMSDDQLAALDADWSVFDEARQAAFTFARKLSFEPYAVTDDDLDALRKHYDDTQVAELVLAIAGFNSTNRWTGPLRIKQDVSFPFVRPTSPGYASVVSVNAPIDASIANDGFVAPKARPRPPLESAEVVAERLKEAQTRTPRLKIADAEDTKKLLGASASDPEPPQWVRFLVSLPESGADRITSYQAVLTKGKLDPRAKAIIAYVGARHDRAWYALGHAIRRLEQLGLSREEIFALDHPEKLSSESDREVASFARIITVDPALVTDDDFARLRKLFDDQTVAEIVYQITQAAFFDRLTEAASLQLEQP